MITGSYILQANQAKFNQFNVDPSCPLCGYETEDIPHVLLECPRLNAARDNHLSRISELLHLTDVDFSINSMKWAGMLLNCGNPLICNLCGGKGNVLKNCSCFKINKIVNRLCLDIHNLHTGCTPPLRCRHRHRILLGPQDCRRSKCLCLS